PLLRRRRAGLGAGLGVRTSRLGAGRRDLGDERRGRGPAVADPRPWALCRGRLRLGSRRDGGAFGGRAAGLALTGPVRQVVGPPGILLGGRLDGPALGRGTGARRGVGGPLPVPPASAPPSPLAAAGGPVGARASVRTGVGRSCGRRRRLGPARAV